MSHKNTINSGMLKKSNHVNSKRDLLVILASLACFLLVIHTGYSYIRDIGAMSRGQYSYLEGKLDISKTMLNIRSSSPEHIVIKPGKISEKEINVFDEQLETNRTVLGRTSMRGFYWHHYASWSSEISDDAFKYIEKSFIDQYGILGALQAKFSETLELKLTPNEFAQLNTILAALNPIIACTLILICTRVTKVRWTQVILFSFIYTLAYLLLLNVDQLTISPGFGNLRYTSSSALCLFFFVTIDPYWSKSVRKNKGRIFLTCVFSLFAFANSMQFNLLILSVPLACDGIAKAKTLFLKRFPQRLLITKESENGKPIGILRKRFIIILSSTVITQYIISILNESARGMLSSSSEGNLNISGYIIFCIGVVIWALSGKGLRLYKILNYKRCIAISPFIASSLYCFNFWGSPDHACALILIGMPIFCICSAENAFVSRLKTMRLAHGTKC